MFRLGDLAGSADHLDKPRRLVQRLLIEMAEAIARPDPGRAIRTKRQRLYPIVWQAAIGARLGVGPPVAILGEPREPSVGPNPERAIRTKRQPLHGTFGETALGVDL